jgi:hypothetical protein
MSASRLNADAESRIAVLLPSNPAAVIQGLLAAGLRETIATFESLNPRYTLSRNSIPMVPCNSGFLL